MSSSLLPAAGAQDRATAIARVRLERVNKHKVRSGNPHPTPNRRPQCSRLIATNLNGVNQKLLFFRTAFQHMIRTVARFYPATAFDLRNKTLKLRQCNRSFHILEPDVSLL